MIILLILFIEPFFTYFNNQKIDKEINLFVDNSRSMAQGISVNSLESYIDTIRSWGEDRGYKTNFYLFGEELRLNGKLDLNDVSTRYDQIVKKINSTPNHLNIILTDGHRSHGLRLSDQDLNSPINIIGLGQSTYEDISLDNVTTPISSNAGDSISIVVYVNSNLLSDLNPLLEVKSEESILYSKNIDLSSGDNRYQYDLWIQPPLDYSGALNIDVSISEVSISENKLNNDFKTQTIIKDISRNALIVTGSLNSNTQEIKKVLNDIPDLKMRNLYRINSKWNESIDNIDLSNTTLIVYDNFPVSKADLAIYKKIEENRNENSKIIFFEGPSYDFNTLNEILSGDKKFSKDTGERKQINSNSKSLNNLIPIKKNLFISNNNFQDTHLMYSDASIAIGQDEDRLYIFIPELSKILINDPYHLFREYLSNIFFLFIDIGEQVILSSSQTEIVEGNNLYLDLNYPDIYDDMKFSLLVYDQNSKQTQTIPFNKIKKDASGRRYVNDFNEGSYRIYAEVESDKDLYTTNQIDVVVKVNSIETSNIFRNENEMRVAGLKSNGNYFNIENYNQLNSLMKSGVSMKKNVIELNIHSFHKFWFILLITLIIEWFLRKRKGLL